MEIINKRHEDIYRNERVELDAYVKFVNSKEIYFSAGCARKFGLQAGLFMHVINDEDTWLLYFNDDEDGFKLVTRDGKRSTVVMNSFLVTLFIKRSGRQLPCKYPLQLTSAKKDGNHLLQIMTDKPMEGYFELAKSKKNRSLKRGVGFTGDGNIDKLK